VVAAFRPVWPVAVLLRPGKTPSRREIRGHLRRLVCMRRHDWPHTHITIRGDSHCGRPEAMDFCDGNGIDFVFGLAGNDVLRHLVEPVADDVRVRQRLAAGPDWPDRSAESSVREGGGSSRDATLNGLIVGKWVPEDHRAPPAGR
jgi:hypothetical protein